MTVVLCPRCNFYYIDMSKPQISSLVDNKTKICISCAQEEIGLRDGTVDILARDGALDRALNMEAVIRKNRRIN